MRRHTRCHRSHTNRAVDLDEVVGKVAEGNGSRRDVFMFARPCTKTVQISAENSAKRSRAQEALDFPYDMAPK